MLTEQHDCPGPGTCRAFITGEARIERVKATLPVIAMHPEKGGGRITGTKHSQAAQT